MSTQITTALVDGYRSSYELLAQQMDSRLRMTVRTETQMSETEYFDQYGITEMQQINERHGDTPINNIPHARRSVTLVGWDAGDLVDRFDKVRTLQDPQSGYMQAIMAARNRRIDDTITAAALGTARTGHAGGTSTPLPSSQEIAHGGTNLTVAKLIDAKTRFMGNEVGIDDMAMLHIACTSNQINSLLNEEKLTNADFANVKALVKGEVDTFMGFKFHINNRLPVATNIRSVPAWAQDGILLSFGQGEYGEFQNITVRDDKRFSYQVYAQLFLGATRMQEDKVVNILCDES